MDKKELQEVRKVIHEELEKAGVKIPVELKFDYSFIEGEENIKKTMEFVRLCNGRLYNAIYVIKDGERDGDKRYFDLLFVANEKCEPVCIPVPLARKLFNSDEITASECNDVILGITFEHIFKNYYKTRFELPF